MVAEFLKKRGWLIIPSYDYSGDDGNKAPRLQGLRQSFVIPDLDTCRGGKRKWVEVKTKANAEWGKIAKCMEHGINLRHWNDYWRIQELTGCSVFLSIYEEKTGDVLISSIDNIQRHGTHTNKMWQKGRYVDMIYFARACFHLFFNAKGIAA